MCLALVHHTQQAWARARAFPHTLLRLTLPLALGGIAIATATLAASQGVAMAAVASLAWGVCDNIAELSLLTITQNVIPLDRRGLFFGVLGSAIMAARQIGLATAGLVADAVGTRVALMTCAALLLLPALFSATRKLEKGTDNVTAD
jgi:predicted MFS family arabinose efflux permease